MNCTLSKETTDTNTQKISARRPEYDVKKLENSYEIAVNLPGCPKAGTAISLENNVLNINATRENVNDSWKTIHRETCNSDYELKLKLSSKIDAEKIAAKNEDGVLTVTLPIAESAQPRTISVE